MTKRPLLAFVFVFTAALQTYATQPDPKQTPGTLCTADDPNFDGYRYKENIPHCARNVTHAMKVQIAAAYGSIPESEWHNYEFDHLIPLNAGGSSSIENLWPQPIDEAHEKDKIEQEVYNGLNNGTMTQAEAIKEIRDWIDAN